MWGIIKVASCVGFLIALLYLFAAMVSVLVTTAYYHLFTPLKAEELTVWAEVPARAEEKTFDQKDYHIQYAENERKYQWTIGGSEL